MYTFTASAHHPQGLSTASGVLSVEDRPSTLGQSQSVMNISRMSPKAEAKKRRAPALPAATTATTGHGSFGGYEVRRFKGCVSASVRLVDQMMPATNRAFVDYFFLSSPLGVQGHTDLFRLH